MRARIGILAGIALALVVPAARAADDAMERALEDLQAAKRHLQQAEKDYDGHRRGALEKVDRAIDEVKQGIAVSERRDTRQDKRLDQRERELEKKEQRLDRQQDKLQQRREDLGD